METPEQGSGRAGGGPAIPGAFPKSAETELACPEKNQARMSYADFRARHLFIGSGVVEAACNTFATTKKIKKIDPTT
ncbi:MAG TPA: hypothetical protein PLQ35_12530 [bacterium]|nr:hypothetical protein [bacterium]HQL63113.1 hypothetical protein [bacterium]